MLQVKDHGFQIGDHVRIVDKPLQFCDAGWMISMGQYCGMEATITGKSRYYRLDIDNGEWWWSEDCFAGGVKPQVLPDLDPVSVEELSSLFGGEF